MHIDAPADGECAAHVRMAACRRQIGLRRRLSRADQRFQNRDAEMLREFTCLVEAPAAFPRTMQRNGDDGVGAGEDRRRRCAHPFGDRTREARSRVVFQCLDDGLKRSAIRADRRRDCHRRRTAAAARTARFCLADDPPGRQRITACEAAGGSERLDRQPAARADGAACRSAERFAADHADWSDKDSERRIRGCSRGNGRSRDNYAITQLPTPQGEIRPLSRLDLLVSLEVVTLCNYLLTPSTDTSIFSASPHKRSSE